jgi:imidazolonepropionase-like amidohydrolase
VALSRIAGVIQLVECQLPKLDVAGSSPVARSISKTLLGRRAQCGVLVLSRHPSMRLFAATRTRTRNVRIARAYAAVVLGPAVACTGSRQTSTAITHVSVIDVASGATRSDNTVIITGNRIVYAGPAAGARIPGGSRALDGRGKFLIPGLWDMHVHAFVWTFSDFAGPLMLANGVTGARDMGYLLDTTLRWKRDVASGSESGPRLVVGVRVDGPVGRALFVSHVASDMDAVRAVDTIARKKDGSVRADFISLDAFIPRAAFFALAREARKLGIPVAGRVPFSVSVIEASDSGVRSVDQEDDLMRACTSREAAFRKELADTTNRRTGDNPLQLRTQARAILSSYDSEQCRRVIQTLASNHTWVTPTLVAYQPYAQSFDSATRHPEWSKYVPRIVEGGWRQKALATSKPDSIMVHASFSFERTGALRRAGVGLLAGTDAPRAFLYPGFSLHEELALLVRSGLSPFEALRTATYNPASFLGALDSLGTIGEGKIADLVLLDADPLKDIRNTTRISAVIANGRVFDSAARAVLLNHVMTALKRD